MNSSSSTSIPVSSRAKAILRSLRWLYLSFRLEDSYLHESGFIRSLELGRPALSDGEAAPWMNHSFVEFIAPRVQGLRILEYGSGYSTSFWAHRADHVRAVEHDADWFGVVRQMLDDIPNADVVHRPEASDYVAEVRHASPDVVVVDGEHRGKCIHAACDVLPDASVVIVDDSNYPYLSRAIDQVVDAHGYKVLSISGMKAKDTGRFETSVLYKSPNAIGL